MRVLADADIFIEIYFNRSEFKKHLQKLCEIIKTKQIDVCVTDKYLKRIHLELFSEQFYRGSVLENIKQAVDDDYITHRIITVTEEIRNQAYQLGLRDLDSAEELICAKEQNVEAIITLNPQNFGGTNFQIINIQDLTDASEDLEGNNSQSIPLHLIKRIFSSLALLGIACLAILYLNEKYVNYRIIKDYNLKKISRSQMDEKVCKNPDYYLPTIQEEYDRYKNTTKLDFIAKGVVIREELKGKVIPAFIARCSFNVKPKGSSQVGSEATIDIGLSMEKWICGSTDKEPMRVINLNNYSDLDSFYCAKTKPE